MHFPTFDIWVRACFLANTATGIQVSRSIRHCTPWACSKIKMLKIELLLYCWSAHMHKTVIPSFFIHTKVIIQTSGKTHRLYRWKKKKNHDLHQERTLSSHRGQPLCRGTLGEGQPAEAELLMVSMKKPAWIFHHGSQEINTLIDQSGLCSCHMCFVTCKDERDAAYVAILSLSCQGGRLTASLDADFAYT